MFRAQYKNSDVAVKRIMKHRINQRSVLALVQEIMLMSTISHPKIVKFIGVCWHPYLLLALEYMERGSLQMVPKVIPRFFFIFTGIFLVMCPLFLAPVIIPFRCFYRTTGFLLPGFYYGGEREDSFPTACLRQR